MRYQLSIHIPQLNHQNIKPRSPFPINQHRFLALLSREARSRDEKTDRFAHLETLIQRELLTLILASADEIKRFSRKL